MRFYIKTHRDAEKNKFQSRVEAIFLETRFRAALVERMSHLDAFIIEIILSAHDCQNLL